MYEQSGNLADPKVGHLVNKSKDEASQVGCSVILLILFGFRFAHKMVCDELIHLIRTVIIPNL